MFFFLLLVRLWEPLEKLRLLENAHVFASLAKHGHRNIKEQLFVSLAKCGQRNIQLGPCFAQTNPVSFCCSRYVFDYLVFLMPLASQYAGAQHLMGGRTGRRFALLWGAPLHQCFAEA